MRLEPKAHELLALLLSRRPNAVSKAEIHQAIWPGASVSESSLPGLVADLRAALGDDWAAPKLIRTVRGYGYAFCGTALAAPGPASVACMRRLLEESPLLALPLAGGPERQIAECVVTFAVGRAGLYSRECSGEPQASLLLRDPATGRGRLVGKLDRWDGFGFTVSHDGKTVLYNRIVRETSELMMIENFQ